MGPYHTRIHECMKLLQDKELNKLIVTSKYNLKYLLGDEIETGERMIVLLIEPGKILRLFVHQMFLPHITVFDGLEIISYTDNQDPIKVLSPYIHKQDKVGIDRNWPSSFLIDMLAELCDINVVKSTLIEKLREIKDSTEINILRQSARVADAVMHQVIELQQFPTTEIEMSETINSFFKANGATGLSFDPIVCFGKNSASPHHVMSERGSQLNQTILLDIGGVFKGYCSDITRTLYHGKENDEFKDVYQIVKDTQLQAIDKIKPGITLAEIDRFVRLQFRKWGLDDYFIHRTGHGIGLELHEGPFIYENNSEVVKEGMVFTIEPGLYLPNKFGVRIEDVVAVTKNGHEVLNLHPRDLHYLDLQNA
jgi:Xaa-Pro dipeptidase